MRTALITISLLVLGSSTAEACNRIGCRFFNRAGCNVHVAQPVVVKQAYVAPVKQYVAPVAYPAQAQYVAAPVYQPPAVYVTNVYPSEPNGTAGLLAKQGSSVYGFSQAAQAYFVNPAEVLRQAAELSRAATATASLGLSGFNQTAQTQLTLQASIAEPLAKGEAAAQVLTAAGLTQSYSRGESIGLRLSTGVAINEHTKPGELPPPTPVSNSVLRTRCAKCHGVDLSEPKGALYFDSGHKLDAPTIIKAIRQVRDGKMPPDGALTAEEKGKILEELLSLEFVPEVFREKVEPGQLKSMQ